MIYPGGLQKHQGLDLAIRALKQVTNDIPQLELHIYGDGPDKHKLFDLVQALGLHTKVQLHNPVDIRQIPTLLAEADIGVVPKRADGFGNEAYSTKILEFMSQGIPVIASRTSIDECYFGDGSVLFFESGNVEALARCIQSLANNAELRRTLAEQGSACVARNNWTNKKQEYLDLVARLLSERDP